MIRGPRSGLARGRCLPSRACLLCLSLPVFPNELQAYGNNLAATILLAAGLVWHMLPSAGRRSVALPQAAGGLQLDANNKAHSQG